MDNIILKEELRQLVFQLGGDLFGVADIEDIKDKINKEYGDVFKDYNRAISAAVFFPKAVINELTDGPTETYLNYYNAINIRLDDIALRVSNFLQRKDYQAFPIPATLSVDGSKLRGIFSHRLAAQRAGLGWIGKNCSLINPEAGPRLRLVTILTNALLPQDKPFGKGQCGDCNLCQEACPPRAIKGVRFQMEESLNVRLDVKSCDDYISKVRESFGRRICGRCLAACPWGK